MFLCCMHVRIFFGFNYYTCKCNKFEMNKLILLSLLVLVPHVTSKVFEGGVLRPRGPWGPVTQEETVTEKVMTDENTLDGQDLDELIDDIFPEDAALVDKRSETESCGYSVAMNVLLCFGGLVAVILVVDVIGQMFYAYRPFKFIKKAWQTSPQRYARSDNLVKHKPEEWI